MSTVAKKLAIITCNKYMLYHAYPWCITNTRSNKSSMEHIPCALCKYAETVVNASCIVYCDLLYRPLEQNNIFTTVDIIIVFMKFWAPFVAENNFSLNQGNTNCIIVLTYFATESAAALVSQRQGDRICLACWHFHWTGNSTGVFIVTSHPFCFSEQKLSTDIREAILTAKIPLLP